MEHMQHHGVLTRLLDWSESVIHAILFAIEPYLNLKKWNSNLHILTPTIWILLPQVLNYNMLCYLKDEKEKLIETWCKKYQYSSSVLENIKSIFSDLNLEYKYINTRKTEDKKMNLIYNLSIIHKEVAELQVRGIMEMALENKCYINPIYCLIDEYFLKGIPVEINTECLPPIAFYQACHSKRMRAQRGVFTMFPIYKEFEKDKIAMENMKICEGALFKIRLYNIYDIRKQLFDFGITRDWLYPEDVIISDTIENSI